MNVSSGAIFPVKYLENRKSKREFYHEANKIAPILQKIIDDFINTLWFSPKRYKYKDIYDYFHNLWLDAIKHILNTFKCRNVLIKSNFFALEYSPKI